MAVTEVLPVGTKVRIDFDRGYGLAEGAVYTVVHAEKYLDGQSHRINHYAANPFGLWVWDDQITPVVSAEEFIAEEGSTEKSESLHVYGYSDYADMFVRISGTDIELAASSYDAQVYTDLSPEDAMKLGLFLVANANKLNEPETATRVHPDGSAEISFTDTLFPEDSVRFQAENGPQLFSMKVNSSGNGIAILTPSDAIQLAAFIAENYSDGVTE